MYVNKSINRKQNTQIGVTNNNTTPNPCNNTFRHIMLNHSTHAWETHKLTNKLQQLTVNLNYEHANKQKALSQTCPSIGWFKKKSDKVRSFMCVSKLYCSMSKASDKCWTLLWKKRKKEASVLRKL